MDCMESMESMSSMESMNRQCMFHIISNIAVNSLTTRPPMLMSEHRNMRVFDPDLLHKIINS